MITSSLSRKICTVWLGKQIPITQFQNIPKKRDVLTFETETVEILLAKVPLTERFQKMTITYYTPKMMISIPRHTRIKITSMLQKILRTQLQTLVPEKMTCQYQVMTQVLHLRQNQVPLQTRKILSNKKTTLLKLQKNSRGCKWNQWPNQT